MSNKTSKIFNVVLLATWGFLVGCYFTDGRWLLAFAYLLGVTMRGSIVYKRLKDETN